ncbi:helix-turn-helix domain-containing protein [Streptomyces sp. NPDC058409]|uniref:helix-turn-helix domain-containing protein n=1 Tax=Streptomyces sp. NPDC058409 TaxID=3346484 RepID=UPI00365A68CB
MAAKRDIWRPVDLQAAFLLDDLDKICAALGCTVADLMKSEPVATAGGQEEPERVVGGESGPVRPVPRREGPRRLRPPH